MTHRSFIHPDPVQAETEIEQLQGVLRCNLDGVVQDVNPVSLEFGRFARSDLVGKSLATLAEPIDGPFPWQSLRQGRGTEAVLRGVHSDGGPFWVKAAFLPVRDETGAVTSAAIYLTDVTQLFLDKLASDARMGAILRSTAVVEFKPDGTIIAANDNFLNALGYSLDEVVGRHHRLFVESEEAARPEYREFWQDLADGGVHARECRRVSKSGGSVYISASYSAVRDSEGKVVSVIKIANDVTSAKNAQLLAEAKLNAFSHLLATIEFTADGTILDANENFLRIMGYSLAEIVGKHHSIFIEPQEATRPGYSQFWRELAFGGFHSGEFTRVDKQGNRVYLVASYSSVVNAEGKVDRVIKVANDVTQIQTVMHDMMDGLVKLAQGDLTARLSDRIGGVFTDLRNSFNTTMDTFGALIESTRQQSGSMKSEAGQIAAGAEELARRGESQAASLEETAAAVEEISGNISSTSDASRDANNSAQSARDTVVNGAQIVKDAILAMNRIAERTKKMADFTRVIENFAFQTNLLSINAAVEAARAGEVGRGFAVVAGEVRNLAQQSAAASQSIAELISETEAEVGSGVRLVTNAGSSLDSIQIAVDGVVENIAGIAHATTEQAVGVREISEALSKLDQANQANLSLSDQYAAAAAALSSQVTQLVESMQRYRTGVDEPAVAVSLPSRVA